MTFIKHVACDQNQNHLGYTYFVTDSGILCSFKEGRVIDKWVDLQVKNSFSIAVSIKFIICTCSEGIIRLFEPVTLKYVGILPKPHPLGIDISSITSPDRLDDTNVYPDSVAIVYDNVAERITTVYSDRSLYMWDIHDLKKIGKYRSFIFHSDCVWGIEPCPNIKKENFIIPFNSFATFSGDGTIRVWNLDRPPNHNSSTTQSSPVLMIPSSSTMVSSQRRNIYSRELVKMIYVDKASSEFIKQVRNLDRIDLSAEDQYPDFGIRSLKMSPDGNWMASGDRNGNLRLHNLINWELMSYQEAHESEILSIDIVSQGPDALIATGSRDRLIHIFEMKSKNHQLIQTLDDHSSSITAVKFTPDATRLISSGADKAVIFRQRQAEGYTTFQNNCGRSTVFDMALNDRCVATVTGERRLYLFHLDSGKPFRMCKPDLSDEPSGGSLINIDLDPFSGTFAVTSGSDRCLRLFDLTNSSCVEKVGAHAEQITAVKFVRTNKEEKGLRVVSTCSDSTIFVWKISPEIVAKMCARAGLTEEKPRARIRRVSTAMGPSVSQNTRKTFSTMSTTEHKYDEVYRKIEANRRRPMTVPQEKKSNGNQKRNTTRPPPPPSPPINSNNNNKLMQNLAHMRQGRNPLERKNSVLAKRPSQPTLASDQRETKAVDEEEDKTNSLDEEEEDDDDDEEEDLEEEIIFTPEQEKVSKPFKVSTHVDTTGEEEDEERLNVSDTPEEEDLSESSGDDEAILRDITSLAPPRVTASRSIIRRSMPRKKRTKRQSFTAKFLSSLPALDANQIAHVSEMKQNDMSNTNQPDDTNQNDNVSDTNQSDHVSIINSNEPRTEMDPKLESALADLDGISILLDSVLDTLVNTIQTKENEKPLSEIKNKLNHVAGKIATQASSPPETIELLEKYSNLLLTMVQNKLSP
ncbi:hypothetical protein G6F56_005465 [Rhizopus delemar]|nr:hypothetical protein G6F56_005465 [Rhizopus delemar]